MTSAESRADRFARELADLKISDPASGHPRGWQRLGGVLMVLGIVLGVSSYLISQRTGDALTASMFSSKDWRAIQKRRKPVSE
jgi:hypothetical protein